MKPKSAGWIQTLQAPEHRRDSGAGRVMHFADDGTRTGRLLVRVLRRAPGEPMPPPEVAATPLVVDWRQLQRWGLSEDRLPPETEVLFRTLSVWERYRTTIVATLAVLLLQSALILWLLVERRRRRRMQAALGESEAREVEQRRELAHLGRVALVGELSATLAHAAVTHRRCRGNRNRSCCFRLHPALCAVERSPAPRGTN